MDLMMVLLLIFGFIMGGGLYNLATAIGEPSIIEIANIYLFFLAASSIAMLVYAVSVGDRSLDVPPPTTWLLVMVATFGMPFATILFQLVAIRSLAFHLYVPTIRPGVLEVAGDGGVVSRIADALANAIGLSPEVLLAISYNIIIGAAETAVFQAFLPAILKNALSKYFGEEYLGLLLACFLSSLMFATLHLVYQGWGGFAFAFAAGMYVSLVTQYMAGSMGAEFPWSAPCIGHSLYNIAVLLLA